jgi:hypothetical protein
MAPPAGDADVADDSGPETRVVWAVFGAAVVVAVVGGVFYVRRRTRQDERSPNA